MKKIKLERELLVPDTEYCIMWKNQREICNMLTFGKVAGKPNIAWKCTFFDIDIKNNINSFGIKKHCEKYKHTDVIHKLK